MTFRISASGSGTKSMCFSEWIQGHSYCKSFQQRAEKNKKVENETGMVQSEDCVCLGEIERFKVLLYTIMCQNAQQYERTCENKTVC